MENILIIAVLAVILGAAGGYVYKAKQRGIKCIGCPNGAACGSGGCSGNCAGCPASQEY